MGRSKSSKRRTAEANSNNIDPTSQQHLVIIPTAPGSQSNTLQQYYAATDNNDVGPYAPPPASQPASNQGNAAPRVINSRSAAAIVLNNNNNTTSGGSNVSTSPHSAGGSVKKNEAITTDTFNDEMEAINHHSTEVLYNGNNSASRVSSGVVMSSFVTQPPKPAKGLTGKISTLFRREASRERPNGSSRGDFLRRSGSSDLERTNTASGEALLMLEMGSSGSQSAIGTGRHQSKMMRNSNISIQQTSPTKTTMLSQQQQPAALSSTRQKMRNSQKTRLSPQERQKVLDELEHLEKQHEQLERQRRMALVGSSSGDADAVDVQAQGHQTSTSYYSNDDASLGNDKHAGGSSSVAVSLATSASRHSTTKRIFYSSNQDDDSDDSYESRVSTVSRATTRTATSATSGGAGAGRSRSRSIGRGGRQATTTFSNEEEDDVSNNYRNAQTKDESSDGSSYEVSDVRSNPSNAGGIRRYRGFSTSIKSLFLDEPLVCAAIGCFGLVLSNRTEYLLQLRNERRGALTPNRSRIAVETEARKRSPSRIVGIGLILMLFLMFGTFIIGGFGSGGSIDTRDTYLTDYMNGYDNIDDEMKSKWWDDYLMHDDDNNKYRNRYYSKNNNYKTDDATDDNDDADSDDKDDGKIEDDDNIGHGDDDANKMEDDYYGNNSVNDDEGRKLRRFQRSVLLRNAPAQKKEQNRSKNKYHLMAEPRPRINANDILTARGFEVSHPMQGIFKLRDYHENVWNPVFEFIKYEWYRGNETIVDLKQRRVQNERGDVHQRNRRIDGSDAGSDSNGDGQSATDYQSGDSSGSSTAKRDIASDIRMALLFLFLFFLGILGRRRRMRTRFYLVRARAQDDHLYYASSDEAAFRRAPLEDSREDQYEGACSHTLCGCYPADEVETQPNEEEVEVTDAGIIKRKRQPHHEDIVARGFACCMYSCCGAICKCWFQCLSICALAQEAREIRLLVPPRYQRIDFITHQPFHEYQEAVNDLRRGWLGKAQRVSGIIPHYLALSRFSRWILVLSCMTLMIIVATLYFNPRAAFSWQDIVVLAATFLQSFLVLFVVHWIFHKSDLSLDAVIKMFTAGFMIAVPSAFFFEGLLANLIIFSAWMYYYIITWIVGDGFGVWIFDHWRSVWILSELFNAFIVAALVEELCKYYTFRAIEHPDLVFLTGLQREKQSESAVEGGLVKYPFASHQIQELAKDFSEDDSSTSSYRSSVNNKRGRSRGRRGERLIELTGTTEHEFDEDESDIRTHRQKAMAITTAMISVAVGLACAENFLYVFLITGSSGSDASDAESKDDILEAWIVLFFRSIFPIHALAAALQSINVIRKFVETENDRGHRVGVGRIIFPAVILHGSFDAVLMGINVFIETSWNRYLDEHGGKIVEGEEPYNALIVNLVAWLSIIFIMMAGLLWYFKENREQRTRLIALDEAAFGSVMMASVSAGRGSRKYEPKNQEAGASSLNKTSRKSGMRASSMGRKNVRELEIA